MKMFAVLLSVLSMVALAAADSKMTDIKDVETLNDEINKYTGKKVRVAGEIKDKVDSRSFVIESGGIFDDEILVVMPPKMKQNLAQFKDDQRVRVTGTVRQASVVDIRREYSWDLDPQIEAELEGSRAYLVADEIVTVKE